MRRLFYLSLLLIIPFLVHADHGRKKLNGKWISPFHGKEIKLKVKRNEIRIKNLTRRGWSTFLPSYRGTFEDHVGNTVRIKNIHELVYRSSCGGERIRFVKKEHRHHNHNCNTSCGIENDFFSYNDGYYGGHREFYNEDEYYSNNANSGYENHDDYGGRWSQRNDLRNSQNIGGRYFVREIDEYITIQDTSNGIRAKRGNREWVHYRQNRYRKNEFIDDKGNSYLLRSNGGLKWKNKRGTVSLNLYK